MDKARKNLGLYLALLSAAVVQAGDLIAEGLADEPTKELVHRCVQGLSVILTGAAIYINPDATPTGILAKIFGKK